MTTHRLRYSIYGVAFIVCVSSVLVVLTIAEFNRGFTASSPLHLKTSRVGLLLDDGSAVKMRGVTVGRVDEHQGHPRRRRSSSSRSTPTSCT